MPDVLVCSVGTEVFWRNENGQLVPDDEWERHLDEDWEPERLQRIAATFDAEILTPQARRSFLQRRPTFSKLKEVGRKRAEATQAELLSLGER